MKGDAEDLIISQNCSIHLHSFLVLILRQRPAILRPTLYASQIVKRRWSRLLHSDKHSYTLYNMSQNHQEIKSFPHS